MLKHSVVTGRLSDACKCFLIFEALGGSVHEYICSGCQQMSGYACTSNVTETYDIYFIHLYLHEALQLVHFII